MGAAALAERFGAAGLQVQASAVGSGIDALAELWATAQLAEVRLAHSNTLRAALGRVLAREIRGTNRWDAADSGALLGAATTSAESGAEVGAIATSLFRAVQTGGELPAVSGAVLRFSSGGLGLLVAVVRSRTGEVHNIREQL
eukprot:TRINITY_DN5162_c0_g1_i6.p2 TRINITY_DN5162_c0_g1~~TRINITY_DN5162_c0_g1_i6.p2  ORF type:complete len:143 (+),score=26.90 TRINITY_DN5162_c0_g1_i6:299-727(+)